MRSSSMIMPVLVLVLTLGTGAAGSTALAHAEAATGGGPVGIWSGQITSPTETVSTRLSIDAGGTMCVDPATPPTGGGADGYGYWLPTGASSFSFAMTERLFGADGTTTGWLTSVQRAVRSGATFDSSGTTRFYTPQWQQVASSQVTIHMQRTSTTPDICHPIRVHEG